MIIPVNRIDDTEKERTKLTANVVDDAGDTCGRRLRNRRESKGRRKSSTKRNKQRKAFQNEKDATTTERETTTPIVEERTNAVAVWSISDNILPKVCISVCIAYLTL